MLGRGLADQLPAADGHSEDCNSPGVGGLQWGSLLYYVHLRPASDLSLCSHHDHLRQY